MMAACIFCLTSCRGLTNRESIVSLYLENAGAFRRASETGDWEALSEINGIERIKAEEQCINMLCGGIGFGGFAGLSWDYLLPNHDAIGVAYTLHYQRIPLDGYEGYAPQHLVTLRFDIANFSFLN